MKNKAKTIDVNLAYLQAKGFLDAAYSLRKAFSKNAILLPQYASAYMVNLGFATEVYLKLLLHFYNIDYKEIHRLKELFDEFPEDEQSYINKEFDKCKNEYHREVGEYDFPYDVQTCLNNYNNAFVDWRYCFEGNDNTIFIAWADLIIVIEIMRKRVKELFSISN